MQSSIFELTGQKFLWRCKHCWRLAYLDFMTRLFLKSLCWMLSHSSNPSNIAKSQEAFNKIRDVRQKYIDDTILLREKIARIAPSTDFHII